MKWLKHAFALDPPGPAEPTESQRLVVERLCGELVRRHLDGVALVALESCRPLHYLGAQVLHVIAPLAGIVLSTSALNELAAFLERRGSIDYLCMRLETLRQNQAARVAGRTVGGEEAAAATLGRITSESTCPQHTPHES